MSFFVLTKSSKRIYTLFVTHVFFFCQWISDGKCNDIPPNLRNSPFRFECAALSSLLALRAVARMLGLPQEPLVHHIDRPYASQRLSPAMLLSLNAKDYQGFRVPSRDLGRMYMKCAFTAILSLRLVRFSGAPGSHSVRQAYRSSRSIMQRCYCHQHVSSGGEARLIFDPNCYAPFHPQIDNGFFYLANTERFHPEHAERMQTSRWRSCDKIVNIPPGWEVAPGDDPNVAPFCVSFSAAIAAFGYGVQSVLLADGSSHFYNGHGHYREQTFDWRSRVSVQGPKVVAGNFNPQCLLFRKRA